jgi:hypothetical protein
MKFYPAVFPALFALGSCALVGSLREPEEPTRDVRTASASDADPQRREAISASDGAAAASSPAANDEPNAPTFHAGGTLPTPSEDELLRSIAGASPAHLKQFRLAQAQELLEDMARPIERQLLPDDCSLMLIRENLKGMAAVGLQDAALRMLRQAYGYTDVPANAGAADELDSKYYFAMCQEIATLAQRVEAGLFFNFDIVLSKARRKLELHETQFVKGAESLRARKALQHAEEVRSRNARFEEAYAKAKSKLRKNKRYQKLITERKDAAERMRAAMALTKVSGDPCIKTMGYDSWAKQACKEKTHVAKLEKQIKKIRKKHGLP